MFSATNPVKANASRLDDLKENYLSFLTVTVKDAKQYQPLKINIAFQILVIKYHFIGIHVIHSFRHPQLQV